MSVQNVNTVMSGQINKSKDPVLKLAHNIVQELLGRGLSQEEKQALVLTRANLQAGTQYSENIYTKAIFDAIKISKKAIYAKK